MLQVSLGQMHLCGEELSAFREKLGSLEGLPGGFDFEVKNHGILCRRFPVAGKRRRKSGYAEAKGSGTGGSADDDLPFL